MGVYVKGMEMPGSCSVCRLFGEYGCPFIGAVGYALTRGERNDDCPLVPVPPHGRLGDYDGLKVKYIVFKASNGALVEDCFVLRPEKDNAAVAALAAYADTTENQVLAADILEWLSTIIPASEED